MFGSRSLGGCNLFCITKRVRVRVFAVLLVVISLVSLVLQRTLLLNSSAKTFLGFTTPKIKNESRVLFSKNEDSSVLQRALLLNSSVNIFIGSITPRVENKSRIWRSQNEDDSYVACKLPELDPFHPSVIKFIKDLGKLHCEGSNYSSFENNVLRIEGEDIVSAQYRKIERTPGDDFGVVLSDPVNVQGKTGSRVSPWSQEGFRGVFSGNVSVDTDFIRVDVVTSSGETKSDVHMHVSPKKDVLGRQMKPGGIPLNVALIMFDSTSAANFRRKMPNSLEYLTKNLNSILLQ
ncbi:uncharacterized protein LOC144640312, partial [Oculina patagonica]